MATRTSIATDNFNRAGPALGANWLNVNSFEGDFEIYGSARANGQTANPDAARQSYRWAGTGTFTDDQYSSAVVGGLQQLSDDYTVGVSVRQSADDNSIRDEYQAVILAGNASSPWKTQINKLVNGTFTTLVSANQAWSNTDAISLEVEGTTLRLCRNGVALGGGFTLTDTSLTTGKPGICGSGGDFLYMDSWEGGNLVSASSGGGPLAGARLTSSALVNSSLVG